MNADPSSATTPEAAMPVRPLARKARPTRSKSQSASKAPKAAPVAKTAQTKSGAIAAAAPDKSKKPKLVRDGFTMPKDEFALIDAVKQRAARGGHAVKKSEVLRAGLAMLAALDDKALLAQLKKVPALKTGRPKKA